MLERLLDRGALLAQLRTGRLGHSEKRYNPSWFASAEALLLMDDGPSDALDEQLALAQDTPPGVEREGGDRFDTWVRAQAEAATS